MKNIRERAQERWVDNDACFAVTIDDDFDVWLYGVTYANFKKVYLNWVKYCYQQRPEGKVSLIIINYF